MIHEMRSSDTGVTDTSESETISDEYAATPETDTEALSKDGAVESQPGLKSTPFREGEKVLAYHDGRIYEAKVLEVDSNRERFYVHYIGWKQKWDEWIDMDRLMTYNKENLQKQKALETITNINPINPKVTRGRKRKFYGKLIDIQIPSKLKKHLVNCCEHVTHMGKLVKLPCSPNVDDIFRLYLEHRSNTDARASSGLGGEIVSGLLCYFEKALPSMLLYKCERHQYEEATAHQISPSKIYGAEHLLRLFEILYHANIEEETLTELQLNLQNFLRFLKKKQSLFFLSTYE